MKIRLLLLFFLFLSSPAIAQCHLDGQVYEEGTQVAGYTCRGGQWV
jgi:hypothetical protein